MISSTLNSNEFNPYYTSYIDKAASIDIVEGLELNLKDTIDFLSKIPSSKQDYIYAEGKWIIKDVLLHIIDTERIFAYRALRIARGDKTPLAGFEQDDYVANANSLSRSYESIIEEYKSVRNASITFFKSCTEETLIKMGEASGSSVSVRAIGYIIAGHEIHHIQVIKERYL